LMRVLALDIGEKRCGIAASDPSGKIAIPISTLDTRQVLDSHPNFRRILADHEPELLVCGLPVSLDGVEYGQASRVREYAGLISQQTGLPLVFIDERLSSSEARRILRESGHSERSMRGKIDMVAASLLLTAYLEAENTIL